MSGVTVEEIKFMEVVKHVLYINAVPMTEIEQAAKEIYDAAKYNLVKPLKDKIIDLEEEVRDLENELMEEREYQ